MSNNNDKVLVEVQDLKMHFPISVGWMLKKTVGYVKAVDGISFKIAKGETLGLVGESGCGKTTTGRTILQLERPTSGRVLFEGEDITGMEEKPMRALRRKMQMIFQDPFGSLNPRMTAGEIIGEPLLIHRLTHSKSEYEEQVKELMTIVGLSPVMMERYPHEFSGGQRQRIGVARALSVRPDLIVCDNRSRPWMSLFRPRLSTYWKNSRKSLTSLIFSSPMIWLWSDISATGLP